MRKFVVFAVLALSSAIYAQQELAVADGSSSKTYETIFAEMMKVTVCPEITLTEVKSTGALDNLDKVISNEANACFVHSDVLAYRAKTEDLSNLKTLLALFSEDVHFVALMKPFNMGGGLAGIGAKSRVLNQLSDLEGLNVGAAGGGFITANVVRIQSETAYKVIQFNSGSEVLAALSSGQIAAAVFVGAAPLPNLKTLGAGYRILTIGDVAMSKMKSVYHRSTVTYMNMGGAPVQTMAADCLLITRVYKTQKFVDALKAFRTAFCNSLGELQETRGTHKAWQQVSCENHGNWSWYEFSETAIKKTK